ncbi:MAG TPA: M15 family metallopeptidase [Candidatus Paceibacterota bacterium]|nr:M15 family metallopeptidase [Candidatus Paceibacterota bacterium]
MTLDELLHGIDVPENIRSSLAVVTVPYYSFSGENRTGTLVVHADLAEEVRVIFAELYALRFPIERIVPLHKYGWSDDRSMEDNNTSAFNYRLIIATDRLSNHSYGRAIDINPRTNPYHARDGKVYPAGAVYDPDAHGAITATGPVVALFNRHGWDWGGDWTSVRDYQHFEKPLS